MNAPVTPKWTPAQLAAIEDRGHDLLVSAAAGSGKTAVLTERVVRLVTVASPANADPAVLEELLIITFTRKAAREMRKRIEAEIATKLRGDTGNSFLRSALDALPRSNIMTLHAFCDRLVRKYFHQAGVPPNIRLMDEEEEREVEREAAREVFQRLTVMGGEPTGAPSDFAHLLAACKGRDALAAVETEIHRLRGFINSLDDPAGWKMRARRNFDAALKAQTAEELPGGEFIADAFSRSLGELAESFMRVCDAAAARVGEAEKIACWRALAGEMKDLAGWISAQPSTPMSSWHSRVKLWFESSADTLEKLQNKGVCGDRLYRDEAFKAARLQKTAERFVKWRKNWFSLDLAHELSAAQLAARRGIALLHLADRVEQKVQELKRRRGAYGFNDVERKTLEILVDPESGGPTHAAHECRQYFKHVLVDEYQDISPLQDAIVRRLSRFDDPSPNAERNLFIVGDVKQSIYRFRRADPALFAAKLDDFKSGEPGETTRRIDLSTNYRSRPGILAGVNAVFERLMDGAVGRIEYGSRARLEPHRADAREDDPLSIEAHWILSPAHEPNDAEEEKDTEETGSEMDADESLRQVLRGIEREADWIARRIREMTGEQTGMFVPGADGKSRRRARPGDCAILVRRLTNDMEAWVEAFARHGIRVRGAEREQLFVRAEIVDLLNALRVADNPFNDIALAAVLRSPMIGLSDNDLLHIRLARRKGPFHEAVWHAAGRGQCFGIETGTSKDIPEELRATLASFFEMLDGWRRAAERKEPEDVLSAILEDTLYESHLAGLQDGDNRIASVGELRALIRAQASRGAGLGGLAEFLRAADEMTRVPAPADEGEEPSGGEGAVQLLTIHKSKGLEFPIVFLARLGSRFDDRTRGDIELDPRAGMALAGVDPERRLWMKPLALTAMRAEEARHARGEELRLLYVAMTRARERLILVGSNHHWKDEAGLRERWSLAPAANDGIVPAFDRLKTASPADFLGPIFNRMLESKKPPVWLSVDYPSCPAPVVEAAEISRMREPLEKLVASISSSVPTGAAIPNISVSPPRPVPTKIYVSALRRDAATGRTFVEEDLSARPDLDPAEWDIFAEETQTPSSPLYQRGEISSRIPQFILATSESKLDAAALGTLTHIFLRHVDLRGKLDLPGLRGQAERMAAKGLFDLDDPGLLDQLPFSEIARFFETDLGRRMNARPGAVLRELPFRRWIWAGDLHRLGEDGKFQPLGEGTQQRILLQGVIDCVIDEGKKAVLIDYKTDRVGDAAELRDLKERYFAQIDAYRAALRAIWRVSVDETYLAFLSIGENVLVGDKEN